MSKYHNTPTVVDNIRFDSKREAARYKELRMLQQQGIIEGLELQPKFPLVVEGMNVGFYRADFAYFDKEKWQTVVEDVKSTPTKTPVYRLKKKLVKALHGVDILET